MTDQAPGRETRTPHARAKDARTIVATNLEEHLRRHYGRENVTRDGDRFFRIKFPDVMNERGPVYVRVQLHAEA